MSEAKAVEIAEAADLVLNGYLRTLALFHDPLPA